MDWSSQVTFKEFCDFLQHLVRTKVKANKLNLMKKFLGVWRARLPSTESSSLFPLMRLLLPQLDKERGAYNIKVRMREYFLPIRGVVNPDLRSGSRRPVNYGCGSYLDFFVPNEKVYMSSNRYHRVVNN
jgi:hypothetical protein